MTVRLVNGAESEEGKLFVAAVDEACLSEDAEPYRVAFDCEGVNLSRLGSVELISICFSKDTYLVDVGGEAPDAETIKAVKMLLEDTKVVKIIHDCRMDCDALFHLHGISLKNVHDTSAYHAEIARQEDKNLNDVLTYYDLAQNAARDKNVYKINPAFWETRPLTKTMIDWASSDVDKLFVLATKQLERITESGKARATTKSEQYARSARDMEVVTGLRVNQPGLFIGRGGTNLRGLQKRTGTLIYQQRPGNTWFVYHDPTTNSLAVVKSAMRN